MHTSSEHSRPSVMDHVTTVLIGTFIAGLTGTFLWSASYLLHLDENLSDVVANVEQSTAQDTMKAQRSQEFFTAIHEALGRAVTRSKRENEFLDSVLDHPDLAAYHKWTDEAVSEATRDLGSLSGFTPETTGLSDSYHNSITNYFKANISMLRSDEVLMKSFANHKRPPATALQEFQERREQHEYANSLLVSTTNDIAAERNLNLEKSREVSAAAHSKFQVYKKWLRLACLGLALSGIGFYLLGRFVYLHLRSRTT